MSKQFKSTRAALAVTLALGLAVQGLEGAEQSAKADEAGKAQPRAEETGPEIRETAPSGGIKTFDAIAVRPVTFVSSVFSTGAFVLALPFAAFDPAMDVKKTGKNLVQYPFGYTFKRPLGDFNGSAW